MPDSVKVASEAENVFHEVCKDLEALVRKYDGRSAGAYVLLADCVALARLKAVYRQGIVDRLEESAAKRMIDDAGAVFQRIHSW